MDCRAIIKIEFVIYGQCYSTEFNINYWPNNDGIDDRIVEWFNAHHELARVLWHAHEDAVRPDPLEKAE